MSGWQDVTSFFSCQGLGSVRVTSPASSQCVCVCICNIYMHVCVWVCVKGTCFLRFSERKTNWYDFFGYFSHDLSAALLSLLFFICWLILPKDQSLWIKIRLGEKPNRPHLFSRTFFFSFQNTKFQCHQKFILTEIKTISEKKKKKDCNPHAFFPWPVLQTESFLVLWCQNLKWSVGKRVHNMVMNLWNKGTVPPPPPNHLTKLK